MVVSLLTSWWRNARSLGNALKRVEDDLQACSNPYSPHQSREIVKFAVASESWPLLSPELSKFCARLLPSKRGFSLRLQFHFRLTTNLSDSSKSRKMPRVHLKVLVTARHCACYLAGPELDAVRAIRAATAQADLAPRGSNVLTTSPRLSADTRACSCVQIGLYGAFSLLLTDAVTNGRHRVIQWPYAAMRTRESWESNTLTLRCILIAAS